MDIFILAPFGGVAAAVRFNIPYLIVIAIVYFFLHLGKSVEARISALSGFAESGLVRSRSAESPLQRISKS